ncbi:magnesium chelatase [Candidatus Chloroploca asiatica]|uniref:Magnesium chelatase n=2 Tax=Candidatus Chloroploca asiatica TaxID=1506545 RepID=A0A2H3KNN6_9CHLR|nr:magnesium chelatase [Candidatus Chloroploca asiatica]
MPTISPIMPYSMIVGQDQMKLALELSFIAPRIGGVLISGQRGTGKSTVVRAFAQMLYLHLPVTLPINATEDRVVGGWQIKRLMEGYAERQEGLLQEADGRMLYIDEVNLLDDHIVNIILDVASTGVLSIQRDGIREEARVRFSLVGTMNPEEGLLRPQLLDRFGLMVYAEADRQTEQRASIIHAVLTYDAALADEPEAVRVVLAHAEQDAVYAQRLLAAKDRLITVDVAAAVDPCIAAATAFEMQGHRGDLVMLIAARALAALEEAPQVTTEHLAKVARLALQHRRVEASQGAQAFWREPEDDQLIRERLNTHG